MSVETRGSSSALRAGRLPALDGVRGVAILLVMFHHMTVLKPKSPSETLLYNWSLFGPHGVDLFFVLSGFLITGILLDTRRDRRFFRNFYVRRTLRIFPLFYAIAAFSFWVLPNLMSRFPQYAHKLERFSVVSNSWPWYFLYCSNYVIASNNGYKHGILDVSWSLSIEEQYYLAWAICVFFISPRVLRWVCAITIAALPLLRITLMHFGVSPLQIYVLTPTRLDAVMWGSLIAIVVRERESFHRFLDRWLRPAAAVCALIILAAFIPGKWDYMGTAELGFGYTAVAIACAGLLWQVFYSPAFLGGVFNSRFLRFFGTYSYSLYLFHLPMRAVIRDTLFGDSQFRLISSNAIPGQLVFYVVATLAVIPLSLLSWYCFESPILKLKSRFAPSATPSHDRDAVKAVAGA